VFGSPVRLPVVSIPANITLYVRGKGAPGDAKVNVVSIDYFSPIFVGDVGNPLCIQVLHVDKSIVSVLGAPITMEMRSTTNPAIIKTCTGPWKANPADDGKAFYRYQPSDVDTADLWELWIKIFLDGEPVHADNGVGNPKVLESV
jgi:hypothetical protein